MPSFSGKFQYCDSDGTASQSGLCQVTFDAETLTLTPQGGTPLALDLGDIDLFAAGEYDLKLTLYTGKKVLLNQFGRNFQNLTHDLLEAYRARLVQCLLLEDLEEIARFDGVAELQSPKGVVASPAEIRLYKSNLAVLPTAATGFQWRLADIRSIYLDEVSYSVAIEAPGERLIVTKLAKRTREFVERLQETTMQLAEKAAQAVHHLFPFLTPDQLQRVARLMKEGHVAPLAELNAIHPCVGQALVDHVVDGKLQPYFEALLSHVSPGYLYTGFKLIRKEEEEGSRQTEAAGEGEAEREPQARESEAPPQEPTSKVPDEETASSKRKEEQSILHWFFFPLAATSGGAQPNNLVAWEATSASGRATYFFRQLPPEQANALADVAKAPAQLPPRADLPFRREAGNSTAVSLLCHRLPQDS
jgi:hypothetical protein